MKSWNTTAYLAVVVTAVACAAMQPTQDSSIEEAAAQLADGLRAADVDAASVERATASTTAQRH